MQYPSPSEPQEPPTGNEPSVAQEMYHQKQQPMQQQWPQQQPPIYPQQQPMYPQQQSMYPQQQQPMYPQQQPMQQQWPQQQPMYPQQQQSMYPQQQPMQQQWPQQQPPIYPQQQSMYPQQQPMQQQQPNSMYPQQSGPYPMQPPVQFNQVVQMQPPAPVNQIIQVNVGKTGPGFLIRALWFIFIGSWLGFFWLNLGYFFVLTVIGLPLGLIILNRLPWVLTLRPASTPQVNVQVAGNMTTINIGSVQQHSFLIRTIYFLCVGWWAGYVWACIGYACCLLIVTLPIGLMMLNRLPAVLTLRRN